MLRILKPEERFTGPSAELPCILSISIGAANQAKAVADRVTGIIFMKSLDHLILASADSVATLGQLCIALSKSGISYGMIPRVLPFKKEEELVLTDGEYMLTIPVPVDYASTFQRIIIHRSADGIIDYSLQRFAQEIRGTSINIKRESPVSLQRNLKALCDKVRNGNKVAADSLRMWINQRIDDVMMAAVRKDELKAKERAEQEKRMAKAQGVVNFINANATEVSVHVLDVTPGTTLNVPSPEKGHPFNAPTIHQARPKTNTKGDGTNG